MNYPVLKAVLKRNDQTAELLLIPVSKTDHVWVRPDGKPWDESHHADPPAAVSYLRAFVEGEPDMVGYDLTITPIAPLAADRAAQRCADLRFDQMNREDVVAAVREIIEQECCTSDMLDNVQLLMVYLITKTFPTVHPQTRRPIQAPFISDITLRGLMLPLLTDVEKALKQPMEGLRKRLMATPDQIVVVQGVKPQ